MIAGDPGVENGHCRPRLSRRLTLGPAVGALEVEEALTNVVTEARDLRKRISSGLVSEKDAREALGNLRQLHAKLVARTASIKTMYEGAVKKIEDPAARVAALKNKYPALRR